MIGLASVSSAEIDSAAEQVPESLYRFFAEEVFGALGAEVQQGLDDTFGRSYPGSGAG